ncbi:hypothetical protein HS088_TW13G01627 [Tripterygium wilfordii]|uniref:3-ketoacyl-CoA synthase n=1 Tax=Tripterygium wilfordii TaxID=458696 RepID=A0A7J7CXX3_TRIWF|nr:probable 3-ketoacyl-CoA synthase 21 [Tripterygium wilfordii]KAF5738726.1 hypothetical protein HS088_TW13G01627 [Tripterygium wilfordii]
MAMILDCILEFPELLFISHRLSSIPLAGMVILYLIYTRKVTIYLVDFACYRPPKSTRVPMSMFIEHITLHRTIDTESVAFQHKILEKSGLGEETCIHPSLTQLPIKKSFSFAMEEAATVMFSAIKDLLVKNKVNPKSIDILISNSSTFSPTPSLTAMVVNKFRMRSNIKSFNLSGMGCSAGVVSVSLANDLLRVHNNSLALIVSTETLHLNWYTGKNPSMMIGNCLFRSGGAAMLISSRGQDKTNSKYELQHIVRTNKAHDDQSHTCVFQDADSENNIAVSISKNILSVAGEALRINIASLGPLILPVSEQLLYIMSIVFKKVRILRWKGFYMPKFKRACEHFCIHAGGKAVIQAIERNLQLSKEDVEASNMTLYRFGNTSSSSIWYELCYIESKGRMKRGNRVWQLAFGSGFKCNSAVWRCVNDVKPDEASVWRDEIHKYPVVHDTVEII